MNDSKLYSAHDIEQLKQKVAKYRDTLTTLKEGNLIEGNLLVKDKFDRIKIKTSKSEGVIDNTDISKSIQIEKYEQQVEKLSVWIDSLNKNVDELNHDISLIMDALLNVLHNNLIEDKTNSVNIKYSLNTLKKNEKDEVNQIEEVNQIKNQIALSSVQQSNLLPSFKQLQDFYNKEKKSLELPTVQTPMESTSIRNKYKEGQHVNKSNFPSIGVKPHQTYNSSYRNTNSQSTIHKTKIANKHTFPIKFDQNFNKVFTLTNSQPDDNKHNPDTEYPDNVSPIGEQTNIVMEEQDTIEVSRDEKQQDNIHKKTSSFLELFRRKK